MAAVGQAHAVKRFFGCTTSFGGRNAGVNKRKFDVFQRGRARQKGRQMKYKADVVAPDGRAPVLAQLCNFSAGQRIFAGIRPIQQAQKVHQGRISRTRAAANCNKLAALDRE
jgi:hypothetical protein